VLLKYTFDITMKVLLWLSFPLVVYSFVILCVRFLYLCLFSA